MRAKTLILTLAAASVSFSGSAQGRHDMKAIKMENLGRGVVAVRDNPDEVTLSWRLLRDDPENVAFDIFRDGKKLTKKPLAGATFYKDRLPAGKSAEYIVKPTKGKIEGSYNLKENAPEGYIEIPLLKPDLGVDIFGKEYHYMPNDASAGDVDGDGEYEIILKWDPSNAHDNAHDGFTGSVIFDCYKLDGTHLWRIDLGENIRAGAHYTQFMVYDLDGDGKAEVVMKTADGTVDGKGKMIGDRKADWRNIRGRIVAGPEYLTVFNGETGEAMQTIDYVPARGNLKDWGDSYANRSERYLAAVAYLDGIHPSVVMCRGYYTRTVLAAFDWDGKELKQRWVFDSDTPGNKGYAGQGNHNLRVADVDGDGRDEIVYGQMTVDDNGQGLYTTRMNHGDAMHLVPDPKTGKYYIWGCHENRRDGTSLRDAATGEVIFQFKSNKDIGRCMAADIDPTHEGMELWSPNTGGVRSFKGELISPRHEFIGESKARVPVNFAVWWDGDLLRELLDRNVISKYDWTTGKAEPIFVMDGVMSNNGTKANPCLSADLVGDWREEVLLRSTDGNSLRLYVSTIPTDYRFVSFMQDPTYRISVATENVAYNQPPEPGFYFGTKSELDK